jgi:transposase-like protein
MAKAFEQLFGDEEECHSHLVQLRWPKGFRCPRCGGQKAWLVRRDLFRCGNCDHQVSVTAGTIFHGSRSPLLVWFRAMWYVTNQRFGVSALGLQKELDLGSYHTAWAWMHKLRTAMVRPNRDRLGGKIELGVTYIGGHQPGKRGRGAGGKVLVVVVAQDAGHRLGRIRLRRIRNASAESLNAVVRDEVEPGSVVRTDGWKGFSRIEEMGYKHIVVPKDGDPGKPPLPLVERVAGMIDAWLAKSHQGAVRPLYFDYYLDEFTFRFNRRTWHSRESLFLALIQQAAAVAPLPVGKMQSREHLVPLSEAGAGPPKPPVRIKKTAPAPAPPKNLGDSSA